MSHNCTNCHHFTHHNELEGTCHLNPPVPVPTRIAIDGCDEQYTEVRGHFPVVFVDDRCASFEEQEVPL